MINFYAARRKNMTDGTSYCKDCRREQYRQRSGKGRERLLSYSTEALLWALRQKGVK